MSSLKVTLIASSCALALAVAFGCGSDAGADGSSSGASSSGTSGGFSDPNAEGGASSSSSSGQAGNVGNVDPNSACATSNAGAALAPISLVFMIDRSGSMVDNNGTPTKAVRWDPVKAGLTSFFGDPASGNISASLAFFPIGNGNSPSCTVSEYANPVVAMTALPNAGAFTTAFATDPQQGARTPTEPALRGAIDAAKAVQAQGKNVAVVLATDGEPNGCSSNPSGVEAIAEDGFEDGIKTYVIGVGPNTGNLNGFAQKGGTTAAIMIPTDNAAQVSADLIKALGQIVSSQLGCNYGLPAPPAGQTINVNAVNVNYTPPGGAATTLPYSADCSNGGGWHYDNTAAPKEIILCQQACDTAKAAAGAKLDIIFGCETAVPPGGTDPNGNVK